MSVSPNELFQLVPPPAHPQSPGNPAGFLQVEKQLGTALPRDYKQLVQAYGNGLWLGFYWILDPFVPAYAEVWFDDNHWLTSSLREGHEQWPEDDPYPIWPDRGGLLMWGGNENGGYLFWLTIGEPDEWPTIHCADRTPEYERFDEPCTQLLFKAITDRSHSLAEVPYALHKNPVPFLPSKK